MTVLDALLAEYQRYLEAERSLSAGTIRHYLRYGRVFLAGLPGPLDQALPGLSAGQVTGYVLARARRRDGAPRDMVVLPALRSLLRFLHIAGHVGLPLAGAVPAGRSWKPGLPRAASADDLQAVLAACDRESAGGRRDYAIVLAMTRLALRGGARWLLIRRNRRTGELAFYRSYALRPVTLAALVKVAGLRWTIEENFQAGKGLAGLDEHQVRTWTSWHRWVTLAMLALAFLTVAAAAERRRVPATDGQVPLTRNEIARLFAGLTTQPASAARHRLRWSAWRRRHQHTARACHCQRQAAEDP